MSFRLWYGGADTNTTSTTSPTPATSPSTSTIATSPTTSTITTSPTPANSSSTSTTSPTPANSPTTSTITTSPTTSTITTSPSTSTTIAPFIKLTIPQLTALSENELKSYAIQVSSYIVEQSARIKADQNAQDEYQYQVMNSQSTIQGLNYEILEDTNLFTTSKIMYSSIINSNIAIDSTVTEYNRQIADQQVSIDTLNQTIQSLKIEGSNIESQLGDAYIQFDKDAKYYSSLYLDFLVKDSLYTTCLNDISTTSSLLTFSIASEAESKQKLDAENTIFTTKQKELLILNQDNISIQSTLTEYILDEQTAKTNVISTQNGIITLSSYYETAIVNQQYYQALSTQGGLQNSYAIAQSNTIQARTASDANPGNQSLLAIYKTAAAGQDILYAKLQTIAPDINTKRSALNIAVSNTYDVAIATAQSAIDTELMNISTFQKNIDDATISLQKYSSLYDQSVLDIASCQQIVSKFTTLYKSSIDGSNILMKKIEDITATNIDVITRVTILEKTILAKEEQYSTSLSSYTGWIEYSTLMTNTLAEATSNYITYSTAYTTANTDILRLTNEQASNQRQKLKCETNIITYSTIIEQESLNVIDYTNNIYMAAVMEEKSAFQYRESLLREKRMALKDEYDTAILTQVQLASTTNGQLAASGTPYTAVPININVPTVNTLYTKLNTIGDFLNNFQVLYETYDMKYTDLQSISSIITPQYDVLKRINDTKLTLLISNDGTMLDSTLSMQSNYTDTYAQIKKKQEDTYKYDTINQIKNKSIDTYKTIFSPAEVLLNETKISSFLIQGYTSV